MAICHLGSPSFLPSFPSLPPSLPPVDSCLLTYMSLLASLPCPVPLLRTMHARISSTPRPRSGNGTGRPHRYSSCLPRNHYTERASERGAFCNIRHGGRQRSRSTRGGAWAGWLQELAMQAEKHFDSGSKIPPKNALVRDRASAGLNDQHQVSLRVSKFGNG